MPIWSATHHGANVTLSGAGLIATHNGGAGDNGMGRADTAVTFGQSKYWEQTIDLDVALSVGGGLCNISQGFGGVGDWPGFGAHSIGFYPSGEVYWNYNVSGAPLGYAIEPFTTGDVLGIAVSGNKLWVRVNGGLWNNDPVANPTTGLGGIDYTGMIGTGSAYPMFNVYTPNGQTTANFGPTFSQPVPVGFSGLVATPPVVDQLATEGVITLFQLDTTMLGGQMFYFQSAEDVDTPIVWGGVTYAPIPMKASGFEMTTRGSIPTPTVVISNLFGAANSLLQEFRGLLGAKLHRILTLRRFLDDGSTPDPNAYITRDMFVIAQKTSHNALAVAFKLSSAMDQEGIMLPRRMIMRDYCSHVYRAYNATTGNFDYSKASCPYTSESAFFDINNNPATKANDMCSHDLNGCKLRFPNQVLPAYFFPGVGRVK